MNRRRQIKKRLREIARDPSAPGAAEEAQRLTGEYRRLSRPERGRTGEEEVRTDAADGRVRSGQDHADGLTEADREAIKT